MPVSPTPTDEHYYLIARAYQQAELEILGQIRDRMLKGQALDTLSWQAERLAEVQQMRKRAVAALAKANSSMTSKINGAFGAAYKGGEWAALKDASAYLPDVKGAVSSQSRRAAVQAAVNQIQGNTGTMMPQLLRTLEDDYARVVNETVLRVQAGGVDRRTATGKALEQAFGMGLKVGPNGKMNLPDYMTMAMRTGVANTAIQGHLDTLQANGIDLVFIHPGPRHCKRCDEWANRPLWRGTGPTGPQFVTDLTSGDAMIVEVYGTLNQAKAAGWGHPNCRCNVGAYLPGATQLPQPRPKWDEDGYENQQKQRGIERQIREWKVRQQLATTPELASQAASKVAEWQEAMRALITAHPYLKRQYKREAPRPQAPSGPGPKPKPAPKPPVDTIESLEAELKGMANDLMAGIKVDVQAMDAKLKKLAAMKEAADSFPLPTKNPQLKEWGKMALAKDPSLVNDPFFAKALMGEDEFGQSFSGTLYAMGKIDKSLLNAYVKANKGQSLDSFKPKTAKPKTAPKSPAPAPTKKPVYNGPVTIYTLQEWVDTIAKWHPEVNTDPALFKLLQEVLDSPAPMGAVTQLQKKLGLSDSEWDAALGAVSGTAKTMTPSPAAVLKMDSPPAPPKAVPKTKAPEKPAKAAPADSEVPDAIPAPPGAWKGKEKPTEPSQPEKPRTLGEMAMDEWVEKVKARYTAFAKANNNPKTDITQSFNWEGVQKAMQGSESDARYLLNLKYLDDELFKEWEAAASKLGTMPKSAEAAYKKAMAEYAAKSAQYKLDLAQWRKDNGITSAAKGTQVGLRFTNAEGINWAHANLPSPAPTTTAGRAAKKYSGSAYYAWNQELRAHASTSPLKSGGYAKDTANLDAGFGPAPEDFIVHRGTNYDEFGLGQMPPPSPESMVGKTYTNHGYVSTSIGEYAAFTKQMQIEILVPKGHRVMNVMPVSNYGTAEREILLSRGTQFYVHSVETRGGRTHVKVEVVPEGEDSSLWDPIP